jgi:hypothetical protein
MYGYNMRQFIIPYFLEWKGKVYALGNEKIQDYLFDVVPYS